MSKNNNNGDNVQQLLMKLAEQGSLASWLNEPDIRRSCLLELKELGLRPPVNHVVFHGLRHTLGAGQKGVGGVLLQRLGERMQQYPNVQRLLERLLVIQRGSSQLTQFKIALLAELRGESDKPPAPDEDTPLEMLVALHNGYAVSGLTDDMQSLANAFTEQINSLFADITAPLSHDPRQSDPQSAADYLRYDSGKYPFVDREAEMQLLQRFLDDDSPNQISPSFRWMLVTGAGGEGKSRLALQLWEKLQHDNSLWQALWLSKDAADTFRQLAAKWRPRRPTLMIIDYPARSPQAIGLMLASMAGNCRDYDLPVRVLLLERDTQGEWFAQAFPAGGETTRLRQHHFAESDAHGVWPLPPLPPAGIVQLMRQRFHDANIKPPTDDALWQKACAVDPNTAVNDAAAQPRPRPLFAAMIAEEATRRCQQEAIDPAQALADVQQSEVLDSLIKRDRDQYWLPAAGGHGDDAREKLQAHEHLLVLATMTQGLDNKALAAVDAELQAQLPKHGMGERPRLDHNLLRRMSGHDSGRTRPLEPDILGEHYVLRWFESPNTDPDLARHLRNSAFRIGGDNTGIFILRTLRDFADRLKTQQLLAPDQDGGYRACYFWSRLTVDLSRKLAAIHDWTGLDAISAGFDQLRKNFSDDCEIAKTEAMAAVNITKYGGAAGDWPHVEAALAKLNTLRTAFKDNSEIALAEAKAAFNVSHHSGTNQDWARVDAMLMLLTRLRADFPNDRKIALSEANTAVNITHHAGAADEWLLIDTILGRLDKLRSSFSNDHEIARADAEATFNVVNHAAVKGDWSRVKTMQLRLQHLLTAFDDDRDIVIQAAKAVTNIIHSAGAAGDWILVDVMLDQLDHLHSSYSDINEITLSLVKAAFNLTIHAGTKQDWARVWAMQQFCAKLEHDSAQDTAVLAHIAAQHVLVYFYRRGWGQRLDLEQSESACRAAVFRINASIDDNNNFLQPECLQIIKDAKNVFPDSTHVAAIYQSLSGQGLDWNQVPPLPDLRNESV